MAASSKVSEWDLGPAPVVKVKTTPVKKTSTRAYSSPNKNNAENVEKTTTNTPTVPSAPSPSAVAPSARNVFDELLAVGTPRPTAAADAVDAIRSAISVHTSQVSSIWPESTLRIGKSALMSLRRCEGAALAARTLDVGTYSVPVPVAVGQVAHKAVQMSWTHPGHEVGVYVRAAITGCIDDSEDFATFWSSAPMSRQSDVISAATVRTTAFLDSFPPLLDTWAPRFEEPITARVGPVVFTGRPDLVMGRPRAEGRRTMFICDFKSSDLKDEYLFEAAFYAVVASLRYGVLPWRSCVLSLSSGEWTAPDFSLEHLVAVADEVGRLSVAAAQVWTEARDPVLVSDKWCRWCPLSQTCENSLVLTSETPVLVG